MNGAKNRTDGVTRRRPRQERAKATAEAIQQATLNLLQHAELDNITTNDIARVAGVSIGSLYQYFKNKEEIIYSILFYSLEKNTREIKSMIEYYEERQFREFIISACKYIVIEHSLNYKSWIISFEQIVRSGNISIVSRIQSETIEPICDSIHKKFGSYIKIDRKNYFNAIQSGQLQVRNYYQSSQYSGNLEELVDNTVAIFLKNFDWDAIKSLTGSR